MHNQIGHKVWAIADGYIPGQSHNGSSLAVTSHEAACILNIGQQEAHVTFTIYYTDKAPVGPYLFTVPPQRTKHIRFDDLKDPAPIPHDTEYACIIESDVPIVVQHTRSDSRQPENALTSTIAFGAS